MIKAINVTILFIVISFSLYATTTGQQDNTYYPETALIQLKQKLLSISPDVEVKKADVPTEVPVSDIQINIGMKKIPYKEENTMRYENLLEAVAEIKKAEEHLKEVEKICEKIRMDYIKGLKTRNELSNAENEVYEAERNLKTLEDKYNIYCNSNLQISTKIRNGLLKLID